MQKPELSLEPDSATNPYRAPSADVGWERASEIELAERVTRLSALVVDYLVLLIAVLVGSLPIIFGDHEALGGYLILIMGTIVLMINLYLLYRNGQTIGKKSLDIKVVRASGERAGLGRLILIRAPVFLGFTMIPEIGPYLFLIDSLLIFGPRRRCLHDVIAGTKVVVS